MKILIFPNDPLIAYVKKGELKDRYFNPNNIFNEVHFITFCDDECSVKEIQRTIGEAKGIIHNLPSISILDMFFPKRRFSEIKKIAEKIDIDIVRSYNPIYQGFFAGFISKILKVPFLISIHTNYDFDIRGQYKANKDKRYLKYLLSKYTVEPRTLKMASHVIGAYNFAGDYAKNSGVDSSKLSIIYNRVYLDKFKPNQNIKKSENIRVICVGNLIEGKGQRVLLSAMKNLPKNISMTFIGDGEDYDLLLKMAYDSKLNERVSFIKSIPNEELAEVYRQHDIFALPIKFGGVCIPALEATASGLALVMPKLVSGSPEIVGKYAELVENSVEGFSFGIQKLAEDLIYRKNLISKGLKVIRKYSGDIMEKKESDLYLKLVNKNENK
ncbi:glycosyltransferase family 4 protein [Pseudothioglobus sp. nBUS_23]|uniref:glycosyltransferase family 4 protein n=1 Tax=Pseudothioglobus sp. nBUS_23 TaxID=3395318 RepID=UPI003EBA85F0